MVIRLPVVYGPAQSPDMLVPELIVMGLRRESIPMTEEKQKRRFIFAQDVAYIFLTLSERLLEFMELPSLLNAPCSEPTRIVDIASLTVELMGSPVELNVGALPSRATELEAAWPNSSLAESLGLSNHTKLASGLEQTIDWYGKNKWFSS
jgi:nucleoside-diphosphate-sugar epimerase